MMMKLKLYGHNYKTFIEREFNETQQHELG